ncbi:hypothetical protein CEXT_604261 [Caerostris extrusa]|uniref:Uncharacterized protein n=1 Tax=Caerostris extrusa TaxID=172846 RepID=A0AAV4UDK4_CAEEX|nr:hypothetical protein CEXT_604261 [Caerostris extrusa]
MLFSTVNRIWWPQQRALSSPDSSRSMVDGLSALDLPMKRTWPDSTGIFLACQSASLGKCAQYVIRIEMWVLVEWYRLLFLFFYYIFHFLTSGLKGISMEG